MFLYINIELVNKKPRGKCLTLSYNENDKNVALPTKRLIGYHVINKSLSNRIFFDKDNDGISPEEHMFIQVAGPYIICTLKK